MIGVAGSWLRGHPRVVDTSVAVAVLAYSLLVQDGSVPAGVVAVPVLLVSVGLCAPYVVRRERPLASFGVVVAAFLAQAALGVGFQPADVMLLLALNNVAVRCGRRVSLAAAATVALCALLGAAAWRDEPYLTVVDLGYALVVIATVWMWGSTVGVRRAHLAGLRDRADALERERESRDRIAVAAERTRIAREIHDVVSHSLSVVVVLAQGASASVRSDPDRAERALTSLEGTGRTALAEMRRMLDVLRDDEPGSHAPQPGIAQLGRLIADARSAGTPAELDLPAHPPALPPGADLAVYRIVQEALTNTRGHAGPDVTRVEVRVRVGDEEVQVRVRDDGRGPVRENGGHGLVGMRERVAAYGGVLHTGARAGGGFEVLATLPLEREP